MNLFDEWMIDKRKEGSFVISYRGFLNYLYDAAIFVPLMPMDIYLRIIRLPRKISQRHRAANTQRKKKNKKKLKKQNCEKLSHQM